METHFRRSQLFSISLRPTAEPCSVTAFKSSSETFDNSELNRIASAHTHISLFCPYLQPVAIFSRLTVRNRIHAIVPESPFEPRYRRYALSVEVVAKYGVLPKLDQRPIHELRPPGLCNLVIPILTLVIGVDGIALDCKPDDSCDPSPGCCANDTLGILGVFGALEKLCCSAAVPLDPMEELASNESGRCCCFAPPSKVAIESGRNASAFHSYHTRSLDVSRHMWTSNSELAGR